MAIIHGTGGDDTRAGTTGDDIFRMQGGGADRVVGDDGNDMFLFGAQFGVGDEIDGGDGNDTLQLNGDYSAGSSLDADLLSSVEQLHLLGAFDYSFTVDNSVVAPHKHLTVNASMTGGHGLTFDGSAETNGHFRIYGSASNDTISGGAMHDKFFLARGGSDTVHGGDNGDRFYMGGGLDAGDQIDGGNGYDTLILDGDYGGANAIACNATTLTGIDNIRIYAGYDYDITTDDNTVANGAFLVVNLLNNADDVITFDASDETDGHIIFYGGQGSYTLLGGAQTDSFDPGGGGGDDFITGGGGYDLISCSAAVDTLGYVAVTDSTGHTFDDVNHFNADVDKFNLSVAVSGSPAAVTGTVNFATMDTDIDGLVGSNTFAVVTVNGGFYNGHVFLFVEGGGTASYQSGQDYLIDVEGYSGTMDSTDFI